MPALHLVPKEWQETPEKALEAIGVRSGVVAQMSNGNDLEVWVAAEGPTATDSWILEVAQVYRVKKRGPE